MKTLKNLIYASIATFALHSNSFAATEKRCTDLTIPSQEFSFCVSKQLAVSFLEDLKLYSQMPENLPNGATINFDYGTCMTVGKLTQSVYGLLMLMPPVTSADDQRTIEDRSNLNTRIFIDTEKLHNFCLVGTPEFKNKLELAKNLVHFRLWIEQLKWPSHSE